MAGNRRARRSRAEPSPRRAAAPASRRAPSLEPLAEVLADTESAESERLIYERVRLGIMSALAVNDSLAFNDLKSLLKTTDGNLSVHARKLEEAGYVACKKSFEGRLPRTDYRITPKGRRALERYLAHMEALIRAMRPES
jgi:DNA-binding MarR family transcriptional regulator